jgi:sugar-specific transcriptional regulator TrmB
LSQNTANTNNNEDIKIITGQENITNFMLQCYDRTKEKLDACLDFIGPSVVATDYRIMRGVLQLIERGIKIRFITDVTKENLNYCKDLMKVSEIRHIDGIKGNFGIMDEQEYVIHLIQQESQAPSQILYSNNTGSAEAQQSLFNTLWKTAIPIEDRRRLIEGDETPDFVETIIDPAESRKISFGIVNSARKEILITIPTVNGFHRLEKEGLMASLQGAAERGVYIRVLTPMDSKIIGFAKSSSNMFQIELRPIKQQQSATASTVIISDNNLSIMTNLKDDDKDNYYESSGTSVYSNNASRIWSQTIIFENLWAKTGFAK